MCMYLNNTCAYALLLVVTMTMLGIVENFLVRI